MHNESDVHPKRRSPPLGPRDHASLENEKPGDDAAVGFPGIPPEVEHEKLDFQLDERQ